MGELSWLEQGKAYVAKRWEQLTLDWDDLEETDGEA